MAYIRIFEVKVKIKFSIISFLFLFVSILASGDLRVLSSNSASITIEFKPQNLDSTVIIIQNQKHYQLHFNNALTSSLNSDGEIPFRKISLGVPLETGNTIQIIGSEYSFIDGKLTASKAQSSSFNVDEFPEHELVEFAEFGISRELRLQSFNIYPVHYNKETNRIKFYKSIVFRVNYGANKGGKLIKDKFALKNILNAETAKNWGTEVNSLQKVTNSVLSSGTWYKFESPDEGIYKIPRSQLTSLGINADNVDPRSIKIYNNGGKVLNEKVSYNSPNDLVEIAIKVVGEEDGKFDADDYIIFYGRGVNFWEYESGSIVRRKHYYSEKNFYWITSGGNSGIRIQNYTSLNDSAPLIQNSTRAFVFEEKNIINIGKTGRDYWGDEFNSSIKSRTYLNSLNGIVPGEKIYYNFLFGNISSASMVLTVTENGSTISTKVLPGYGDQLYILGKYISGSATAQITLPNERSTLKFAVAASSSGDRAYIDYYEIEYKKLLKAFEDKQTFFSLDTSAVVEYTLSNFSTSSINVFDVTDNSNVKIISAPKISGGQCVFQKSELKNNVSKYLAVTESVYKSITGITKVENSNVSGITSGAEYVIVTHKKFKEQAERLADYRQNSAPKTFSSVIVYVDEIYNEFSGGLQDPTAIRNFLKYAYQNWTVKPFFLMLFGDGTYDYFDKEKYSNNYVPTYQTQESLWELFSYTMDDYYGRIVGDDLAADLAVGRLTVNSTNEAKYIVDKIILYESKSQRGLWRNSITLVADDGLTSKGNDGSVHTFQSERLATTVLPAYLDKNKLYLSAYPTTITGLGRRKPGVNAAIIDAVNNGTLIMNFIGHGNPEVWTHEFVFEKAVSIPQFKNDKFFFITAATCDFGKYDDPAIQSATEEMLLLNNRGMIGAFTAARLVTSSQNAAINEKYYSMLFSKTLSTHGGMTVGEAYYLTKREKTQDNDEKFHLFSDPALRLNLPTLPINIDKVNNTVLTTNVQLSALGEATVEGSVKNSDGAVNTNFNGEGIISVFDSERNVYLSDIKYSMKQQGGVIFRGRVSVENGEFSASFRVPKDISYDDKNGKIVAYLFDDQLDGIGFTEKIRVGGTDTTAVNDGEGPTIDIFFDDFNFENSYLVNPDFNLLVKITDESGLNTTGTGIGHKLEGILDDNEENAIDFTNFFVGDLDAGGKSGKIDYKFTNTETGEHKIKIKAWDIFNNQSNTENNFSVVTSSGLVVRDVYNYPNPFRSNTVFTFQHNVNSALNVKIKIYSVAGRLIKEIEKSDILDKFVKIDWDGRDEDGSSIANGTYLYKIIIKSTDGDYKNSVLGKLAVIR